MHAVAKEGQEIIAGRLTKDPQEKGDFVVVSVAVDLGKKDGERQTEFVDVTFTKKLAEIAKSYLVKGQFVAIVANASDKTVGEKTYHNLYADRMTMGPKPAKRADDNGDSGEGGTAPKSGGKAPSGAKK